MNSEPQSWCYDRLFQEQSEPRLSPEEARGPWVAAIFPCPLPLRKTCWNGLLDWTAHPLLPIG